MDKKSKENLVNWILGIGLFWAIFVFLEFIASIIDESLGI